MLPKYWPISCWVLVPAGPGELLAGVGAPGGDESGGPSRGGGGERLVHGAGGGHEPFRFAVSEVLVLAPGKTGTGVQAGRPPGGPGPGLWDTAGLGTCL